MVEIRSITLSLRELADVPPKDLKKIPDKQISSLDLPEAQPDRDTRPVIFGHYWMTLKQDDWSWDPGTPVLMLPLAKKGKLAAYRFSGESELSPDKLIFSCK